MIQILNLEKSYGKENVLNNLNLTIHPGRITGIVGENGAGKSTFFKCLYGMVSYDGKITSDYESIRKQSGYLETNPAMLSLITGEEYLILYCNARNIPIPDFLRENIFHLPLHKYASKYSTGMKKKLALTAILLQDNDIFILDEPFNGVDLQSNLIIKNLLVELREKGKTILISSHILSILKELCDEIHILKQGKIQLSANKTNFHLLEKELTH